MGAIINQGIIYGGGEHEFVPKTAAQYEALTPVQKNIDNYVYLVDDPPNQEMPNTPKMIQKIKNNISDQYDPEKTYNTGDRCICNNQLKKCKVNDVTGEYDSAKWENTSIDNELKTIINSRSYVGMIVESTTLDTMAKVIAVYGGTTWIQHSGYVLRGASSGVTANTATKTGGSDDAIVVSHNHGGVTGGMSANSTHEHKMDLRTAQQYIPSGGNGAQYTHYSAGGRITGVMDSANIAHTHTINSAGSSGTNANIPNYKSVYIWERTV